MKKILFVFVLIVIALSNCTTFVPVLPTSYSESTAYSNEFEILGFVSVDIPLKQDSENTKGIKEVALDMIADEYPEADDIIDVTITTKQKITIVFSFIKSDYIITVEGNAVKYID